MTTEAFIGIGSNLGDRVENCLKALQMLQHQPGIKLIKVSSFYEAEPVEVEGGWFVNGVAKIETFLDPRELLDLLQGIEGRLGR
ncbi:MAG: 2-amino-4-hydroxy-6-hydroxymethyldihydropteridine diphosphokinase, partial [Candidatus Methylomirabilales bacterium]